MKRTTAGHLVAFVLCFFPCASLLSQRRDVPAASVVIGSTGIGGQVVTDDVASRPVRHAIVTITGDLPAKRSVITDDEGRFAFERLPAGRFTVSATKPAYLDAAYGAVKPDRPGTPISLARDERVNITLRLARGAVITGAVTDQNGDPLPAVQVTALSVRECGVDPTKACATAPPVTTDDRGVYRIYGLLPGKYVIAATPRVRGSGEIGKPSIAEMDAIIAELTRRSNGASAPNGVMASARPDRSIALPRPASFAPSYFPGTPVFEEATPVTLGIGSERTDVNFQVRPIAALTLEGTVSGPVQDLAAVQLSIISGRRLPSSTETNPILSLRPTVDGRFRYSNVAPGHYTIMARASPTASAIQTVSPGRGSGAPVVANADVVYAVADLDVGEQDINGVSLTLQPGGTLSGRIEFDPTTRSVPSDWTKLRLTLSLPSGSFGSGENNGTLIGNVFRSVPPAQINPDGSFTIRNVAPGHYVLRGTLPAESGNDWWLRSAMVNDHDVLDRPLEFMPGDSLTNAVLTFSDRHTELSGVLQTPAGLPATEYFVVAFPTDRALWQAGARRVQMGRPASDGTFVLRDLPGGDYLIAALTDVDASDLGDPAFLDQVAPAALKITLADGEKKTQDLKIAGQ